MTAPTDNAALESRARQIAQEVVPYDPHSRFTTERQRERRRAAKNAARLALAAAIPPEQDGYAEGRAREVLAENGIVDGFSGPVAPGHAVMVDPDAVISAMLAFATDRHAEGRIAGLEEAAKECDETAEVAALTGNRALQEAAELLATAIRTIANGGTAA